MCLVTTGAPADACGHVPECERPPLVSMAGETRLLIGVSHPQLARGGASMGRVAVHATHGTFLKAMAEGLSEFGTFGWVTTGAQLVGRANEKIPGLGRCVDVVTTRTGHRLPLMRVEESIRMRPFTRMAVQADGGCSDRTDIRERTNLRTIHGIGVLQARSMAGFTRAVVRSVDSYLLIRVRVGAEVDADVLVTNGTHLRADVLRTCRRRRQRLL